ncbi:imidazole glycerol phosphate synthase cyclase subunit [Cutibacterium acnes JCM 18918]|nr:imidazole glycerol phosphate synthase cyclase subunit [Cutibacterium acnes JCM 18918]
MIEAVRAAVDVPSSLQVELERLPISSRRRAPELTRCSPRQFFHYHTLTIAQIKDGLRHAGFEVR